MEDHIMTKRTRSYTPREKGVVAAVNAAAINCERPWQDEERPLGAAKKAAANAHNQMLAAVKTSKRDISRVCDHNVSAAKALADAVRAYAGK
jgi:hypothetical protein